MQTWWLIVKFLYIKGIWTGEIIQFNYNFKAYGWENSWKRLVSFNKECILAGPRQSVVSFLKMLMNLGADVTKATSAKSLITSKSNIVLLLKNEGKVRNFLKSLY